MKKSAFDLIFTNGLLVDGTGSTPCHADLGVVGGTIAAIGNLSGESALRRINLEGRCLAPGFIDAHCHTDTYCAEYPGAEGKILQGVTTDICGLCGGSAAPVGTGWLDLRRPSLNGRPPEAITFAQYAAQINRQGNSTNMAMLVGNSNLRTHAMGFEDRPSAPEELEKMKAMLRQAMEDGAWGLSTGLTYVPSEFASTEELIALCREMTPYGGIYNSHMRNESDRVVEAVAEVIEIARKSGCKGHISHLKTNGRQNWGKAVQCLALIEEANREGIDITFDVHPYNAGSLSLSSMLPRWVLSENYGENFCLLKKPESRARIAADLEREDWENIVLLSGYDQITVSYAAGQPRYNGKTVTQIAGELGVSPFDAFLQVLIDSKGDVMSVFSSIGEEDLQTFLQSPYCSVGTDAFARHYAGPTAAGTPHPRNYGGFPRFLRRYVLDGGLMSLEEGVRKITGYPAQCFGLKGRGLLRVGYHADLVAFDPDTIAEQGDYSTPNRRPIGIDYVVVSGKLAVDDGQFRDLRAGRMLLQQR